MKVLKSLLEQRDAAQAEVDAILNDPETGEPREEVTDEQEARANALLADIDGYDSRIRTETKNAKRDARVAEARELVRNGEERVGDGAGGGVAVLDEPMVYGEGSPHSYFADLARCYGPAQLSTPGAQERLAEWSHQVEREIAHDSETGRGAVKQLREKYRTENGQETRKALEDFVARGRLSLDMKAGVESRAVATGGGATASASGGGGAAFVTPVFYVSDYAPFREFGRAFADQCNAQPLPDYGMTVYMPYVSAKAGVASQTEGTGVNESDPSFGYLSAGLVTYAGEVTLSQQFLDRAGPNFSADRMIFDQLQRDYAPQIDTYTITQALAAAQTSGNWTGNSGAFVLNVTSGSGGFEGQVRKGKGKIKTTQGTVMNPTHLFLDPNRYEYIAGWSDSQGRAVVVPDYAGPMNALANSGNDDAGIEGYTQTRFAGLPVYCDGNLPTPATGHDQAVVACMPEVYLYEGPTVMRVVPQTLAGNLQSLLQLYAYVAVLIRYPNGVYTILGTGMGTISYTN